MKNKTKQFGITLIELIVVIAVIAIMATAMFVIVKPADNRGKIEQTKAAIELLCAALEQYHNFYNEFPDANDLDNIPGYFGNPSLKSSLKDEERWPYRLSLCPDAVAILNQINSKMVTQKYGTNPDYVEYIDAWDKPFKYEYDTTNFVNFPLITSAGPDRDFATKEDNIDSRK